MSENLLVKDIWTIATTLSQDAQNAAREKCKEKNYDENKGLISLTESFSNLSQIRDLLIDAVEKDKLTQLPLTIQSTIKLKLESTSKLLTSLVQGTDAVEALVKSIEDLYSSIWQLGLHNLSEEFLGYQTKLNQLKSLEVKSNDLIRQLEEGTKVKNQLAELESKVSDILKKGAETVTKSEEESKKVSGLLQTVTQAHNDASAKLAIINEKEKFSSESLAKTQAQNTEATTIVTSLKTFFEEVNSYREAMSKVKADSETNLIKNNNETEALLTRLKDLEKQIEGHLQKATGASLFHSFQKRKNEIVISKYIWMGFALTSALLIIGLTIYIASTTGNILEKGFFIKLSGYGPLLYLIYFCTSNYSNERRLEEEYAFKSNISLSLVPYKELVEDVLDTPGSEKYHEFLIKSIENVFKSPTEKVFSENHDILNLEKITKTFPELLKEMAGLVKELTNATKSLKP